MREIRTSGSTRGSGRRALAWPLSRFAGGGGSGDDLLD